MRVLVTGATGYVGSRLIPALLEADHEVVAAVRSESDLDDYEWAAQISTRLFDIERPDTMSSATHRIEAVIYLVHSMSEDDFVTKDHEAAVNLSAAMESNGVDRIVYLSGLIPREDLSDHLASRLQVEEVFLESQIPATVLRAAMVIGAGSTSFEIMRRMSERVPFTPIPPYMNGPLQPIAIEDVVALIVASLAGKPRNRHYDVGGPDVVSYPELLATFASVAELKRWQFTMPIAPPGLVSRVIALISGLPRPTVSALVESLSHEMVCHEDDANTELLPAGHELVNLRDAIQRSLRPPVPSPTDRDIQAPAPTDPA